MCASENVELGSLDIHFDEVNGGYIAEGFIECLNGYLYGLGGGFVEGVVSEVEGVAGELCVAVEMGEGVVVDGDVGEAVIANGLEEVGVGDGFWFKGVYGAVWAEIVCCNGGVDAYVCADVEYGLAGLDEGTEVADIVCFVEVEPEGKGDGGIGGVDVDFDAECMEGSGDDGFYGRLEKVVEQGCGDEEAIGMDEQGVHGGAV